MYRARYRDNSAAVECASAPTRPAPDGRGRGFAGAARGRRLPRSVPLPRPSHSEYFARGTLKAPAADRRHSAVGSCRSPDLSQAHQSVIWMLLRPLRSGCRSEKSYSISILWLQSVYSIYLIWTELLYSCIRIFGPKYKIRIRIELGNPRRRRRSLRKNILSRTWSFSFRWRKRKRKRKKTATTKR